MEQIFSAALPLAWVRCDEEDRVIAAVQALCVKLARPLSLWSATRGLRAVSSYETVDPRTTDPNEALEHFCRGEGPAVLVLCDPHPFLPQAVFARRLKELSARLAPEGRSVLVVCPVACPNSDLASQCLNLEIGPPELDEVSKVARALLRHAVLPTMWTEAQTQELCLFARGMQLAQLSNALTVALQQQDRSFAAIVATVQRMRRDSLRAEALLEAIESDTSLDSLGGMQQLKRWLDLRQVALTAAAREAGIDAPKGLLLLGVQGCGKSSMARAIASRWGLPLFRLDVGKLMQSLVGASEANLRRALAQAESMAPCVLWIDELSRSLAGVDGGGDSGTSSRMLGYLLTWLQEHRESVFVVATTNDVQSLPPELLRRGRFDELFFVDLPTKNERAEIALIHLQRRKQMSGSLDLDTFAKNTEGFVGAELEQCVVSAILQAFAESRPLESGDLSAAARALVPLSRLSPESLDALRRWAHGRARWASESQEPRVAL
ncbi:MAG: AAA family ATPase [Deltaproteobacteria bacterium]|nr:AAA family ATPase [Deltaproteobacteria bacterium]